MIKHIVLFKFDTKLEDKVLLENLKCFGASCALTISSIQSYSYGKNNSQEKLDQGYNFGFTMEFTNSIERDIYVEHSDHKKLVEKYIKPYLAPDLQNVLVFDYEF